MPRRTESIEGFQDIRVEAVPEAAPQFRPAPSLDEVRAYWASGRAKDEAAQMMEAHRVKCASGDCDRKFYYIPQPGEEVAPTDLLCEEHGKQLTA